MKIKGSLICGRKNLWNKSEENVKYVDHKNSCEHIINLAQIAHRLKHDPFFLLSNFQHVALFVMKTIKFDLSNRQLGLVICRIINLFFMGM